MRIVSCAWWTISLKMTTRLLMSQTSSYGAVREAPRGTIFRAVPSKHQLRLHFLEVTHGLKSDFAEKPGPFLSFQHLRYEVALARSISMTPTREPLESSEQSSGDPLEVRPAYGAVAVGHGWPSSPKLAILSARRAAGALGCADPDED